MKKTLVLFLTIFYFLALQIQAQAPPGHYEEHCFTSGGSDWEYVEAWYNDPDGDCISNDWTVYFWNNNVPSPPYTSGEYYNNNPSTGGYINFGGGNWDCCNDPNPPIGGGGSTDPNCSCDWSYTGGVITIDCGPCNGL